MNNMTLISTTVALLNAKMYKLLILEIDLKFAKRRVADPPTLITSEDVDKIESDLNQKQEEIRAILEEHNVVYSIRHDQWLIGFNICKDCLGRGGTYTPYIPPMYGTGRFNNKDNGTGFIENKCTECNGCGIVPIAKEYTN